MLRLNLVWSDWQTPLTSYLYASELLLLNDITTRGFTGHEQVDSMGIIHVKGLSYSKLWASGTLLCAARRNKSFGKKPCSANFVGAPLLFDV
jgi:hypothetical protein